MAHTEIRIARFAPAFAELPAATQRLLSESDLRVSAFVERITLHGSRGPGGRPRPESDVDLCLRVDATVLRGMADPERFLGEVLAVTTEAWRSAVPLDLAVVFDRQGCGLRCMDRSVFDPELCDKTVGCIGVFKQSKGFTGFVTGPVVDCRRMVPLTTIWTRPT